VRQKRKETQEREWNGNGKGENALRHGFRPILEFHSFWPLRKEGTLMALVARGHATPRCAIVRRAETSGPPQEARHTCSGVCVPIIRSACPLPPSSPGPLPVPSPFPALSLYSALHIRRPAKRRASASCTCDTHVSFHFVLRSFDRWLVLFRSPKRWMKKTE